MGTRTCEEIGAVDGVALGRGGRTRGTDGTIPTIFRLSANAVQPSAATVQPLFSTIRCKTLNIFIKVCYSLPCLSKPFRARLHFPLLEDPNAAGNGFALSDSLPLLFS